jgi:DNA-binding beta-propeller fold protein YncE
LLGQFGEIADLGIDTLGNVFVVGSDSNRIQKFSIKGDTLLQWGGQGSTNGLFQTPVRTAMHKGSVYVGEWNGKRIQEFDFEWKFIRKIDVG